MAGDHDHHDHDHHHGGGSSREERRARARERGSFGGWISNWNEYDASTTTKLGLAARNLFVSRWRRALLCCGHPGQPGC